MTSLDLPDMFPVRDPGRAESRPVSLPEVRPDSALLISSYLEDAALYASSFSFLSAIFLSSAV